MLRIVNNHPQAIDVAIWYYYPGCAGNKWAKRGWWTIQPYSSAVVYGGDLRNTNPYFCYYARSVDGVYWTGDYHTAIPDRVFNWCLDSSSADSHDVGFRLLNTGGYSNYTLTLHGDRDPVPFDSGDGGGSALNPVHE